jgi:hypothetical protein
MIKLVPLFVFLLMNSFAAAQSDQQPAIGVVRSEAGKPLADVLVCARTYECLKTDTEGRYDLHKLFPGKWDSLILKRVIARFSHPGYKPNLRTYENTPSNFDVILSEGHVAPWIISPCSANERRQGFAIKVLVPKGTKIAEGHDIDYVTINFRYGKSNEWMSIGSGPNWSDGLPPSRYVRDSVSIEDRDVELPLQYERYVNSVDAIDARGQSKDGTKWRYIGRVGESLSYGTKSEAAAKFFDSIIDSACYQLSKTTSK